MIRERFPVDDLTALVESGPLWDGDVPSKLGRDYLIEHGLAVRVIVRGSDGYTAATYAGRDEYKRRFGEADTINEGKAFRIAGREISRARHRANGEGK